MSHPVPTRDNKEICEQSPTGQHEVIEETAEDEDGRVLEADYCKWCRRDWWEI